MCEKEKCLTNGCETCSETRSETRRKNLVKRTPDGPQERPSEQVRQELEELDALFIQTLVDIVKSGKATPGHLNVMRQVLKDRGYSLPELMKKARMENDAGSMDEDFDESELIH